MSGSGASRLQVGLADSSAPIARNSRRPNYSRFTQQELAACKPILTPKWVIIICIAVGILFIPIGIAAFFASRDVVEIVDQYETDCLPQNSTGSMDDKIKFIQSDQNKTCERTLTVTKEMKQPIYVYYELSNFYQNNRRYVQNVNDDQLMYANDANDTSGCSPEDTTADGSPIVPCGLIAWSLFNDTYSFVLNNIQPLTVNTQGIAWKSDIDHKFGSDVYPSNFQNGTLIGGGKLLSNESLSEQENLIVWMRTAALPTFRKLYGKIEMDLQPNDIIQVILQNNYNTYSFSGEKKLVLSTSSWLGGKNDFLGILYLTVGGLCLFLAMVFTAIYLVKPRRLGDPSYLSWNRNPGGR